MTIDQRLLFVVFVSLCLSYADSIVPDANSEELRDTQLHEEQTESDGKPVPHLGQLRKHMLSQLDRIEDEDLRKKMEQNIRNLSEEELKQRIERKRGTMDNTQNNKKKPVHAQQDDLKNGNRKLETLDLTQKQEALKRHIKDKKLKAEQHKSRLRNEL